MDLETPLGFACFLANASNHRKVFVPSTFNMSKILTSVHAQQSVDLVCDSDFFSMQVPAPKLQEYKDKCSSVQNVIVAGKAGSSQLFSGSSTSIDPLMF